MGFSFGNALASVQDPHIRACFMRLGREIDASSGSLSLLVRNSVPVTDYALASLNLEAGSGLTGGGDLSADRAFNVGAGFGISVAADTVAVDQAMVPTWSGVHTFGAKDVHNSGVDLGTSGRLDSHVVDGVGVSSFTYRPSVALTSGIDRTIHNFTDQSGNTGLAMRADSTWQFGTGVAAGGYINVSADTTQSQGINFIPTITNTSGTSLVGKAASNAGGQFAGIMASNSAPTGYLIGGVFNCRIPTMSSGNTPTGFVAGMFRPGDTIAANSGKTYAECGGIRIVGTATIKNAGTFTDYYGAYVENPPSLTAGHVLTNLRGLYIEEQTRGGTINNGIFFANATAGYKAIAIRDQNAWIGSAAAGELTIGGTNFRATSTNQGFFSAAAIAQPTTGIAASTFVANTSGIVDDSATWDGYTIGQVVKALRNLGLLA